MDGALIPNYVRLLVVLAKAEVNSRTAFVDV
jgi:hypothetical protein